MITAIESLKAKFREVLAGFERYNFTEEQLAKHEFDLLACAHDLAVCKACDGQLCRTIQNLNCHDPHWHTQPGRRCGDECYPQNFKGYYALYHVACRMYERPGFAVYKCPGHVERKAQLQGRMQSRWYDD